MRRADQSAEDGPLLDQQAVIKKSDQIAPLDLGEHDPIPAVG
ncbi:hypothetical protein [Streptomyces adonidis]